MVKRKYGKIKKRNGVMIDLMIMNKHLKVDRNQLQYMVTIYEMKKDHLGREGVDVMGNLLFMFKKIKIIKLFTDVDQINIHVIGRMKMHILSHHCRLKELLEKIKITQVLTKIMERTKMINLSRKLGKKSKSQLFIIFLIHSILYLLCKL